MGMPLWQTKLHLNLGACYVYPSAPAIGVDGTLYHITQSGHLYAIAPQSP
jgi:hypothetical protein